MSTVGRPRLLDAIEATTLEGGKDIIVRALKMYSKKNAGDPKLPDMMEEIHEEFVRLAGEPE